MHLVTWLRFGISVPLTKNRSFSEFYFLTVWFSMARVIEPLEVAWPSVTYGNFRKEIQVWRPVRESNPCRRREREENHCNSTELSGMDSTLPHFTDSEERLMDS